MYRQRRNISGEGRQPLSASLEESSVLWTMSSETGVGIRESEMEVDVPKESADFGTHIVDSNPGSPQKSPKDRLIELLDQVESHVDRLRRDALKLEEDRDTLLTTIDTLRNSEMIVDLSENEREYILHYSERITNHCLTVDVMVKTTRDGTQEDALHEVNRFIDSLVVNLKSDPFGTKSRCLSFMNSCTSTGVEGSVDKNFETAILGCALDDQKRVRRRLQGLLDYIDQLSQ